MKMKFKLIKDMLTETSGNSLVKSYSQARVYLLISVFTYFIILSCISARALKMNDVDLEPLKTVLECLQWIIEVFCFYVFGSKTIDAVRHIMGKKDNSTPEPAPDSNPPSDEIPK